VKPQHTEVDGYLIFSALVNAAAEEKDDIESLWQVRYGPEWTGAIVAKTLAAAVADIWPRNLDPAGESGLQFRVAIQALPTTSGVDRICLPTCIKRSGTARTGS
jgi:hypothetical protein